MNPAVLAEPAALAAAGKPVSVGYLITYYRTLYSTGHVYLGILFALLCALVANWALNAVERRFMRWRDLQISQK